MRPFPPLLTPAQGAPLPSGSSARPGAGFALSSPRCRAGGVFHAVDLCSLGLVLALPSQAARAGSGCLPLETKWLQGPRLTLHPDRPPSLCL